jgi:hypothetical protein
MPQKHQLKVKALLGVPDDYLSVLYEAMRGCSTDERLLVCMYFMSDLDWRDRHLDRIEQNVRKIFPPAPRTGYRPQDYKDFQASAIRFRFDEETSKVRKGTMRSADRSWDNPGRGCWSNTVLGNKRALELLDFLGISVSKPQKVIVQS